MQRTESFKLIKIFTEQRMHRNYSSEKYWTMGARNAYFNIHLRPRLESVFGNLPL